MTDTPHPWHARAGGTGVGWRPTGCPVASYGTVAAELEAGRRGALVVDRSGCARLHLSGPDRRGLVQRLSTADVAALEEGQGAATVFTTQKGRIVDRVALHAAGDGDLVVGGADRAARLAAWIQRFVIQEQVEIQDVTAATAQVDVVGPRAAEVVGAPEAAALALHQAAVVKVGGVCALLTRAEPVAGQTLRLVVPAALLGTLMDSLVARGGKPGGSMAYNALRLEAGLPLAGPELDEEYNPLEAGLVDAIHFGKGCYVGQEVVLRVDTYMKQRRYLVGVEVEGPAPEPGSDLKLANGDAGSVTSAAEMGTGRSRLLGYVKSAELRVGQAIDVCDRHGTRAGVIVARPAQPPAPAGREGQGCAAVA